MRVFLSSTYVDLVDHRKAAAEALERLGQEVGRMEVFGARPQELEVACLKEIEECDLFVGIYAHRYGFIPKGANLSITESEFRHSQKLAKPAFCFVIDEDYPWAPKMIESEPGRSKLNALKQAVRIVVVKETFTTPDDLAFKIAASLGRFLARQTSGTKGSNPYADQLCSSGDFVELLDRSIRVLESITATDYNQIFLATTSAYSRELVAVADAIPAHKQRYHIATFSGLLGAVFSSGITLNAANVHERLGYFQAVLETRSELVVPIRTGTAVIGVLNSESEELEHFDDRMRHEVELLALGLAELVPLFGWHPGMTVEEMPWIQRKPQADDA